MVKKHHRYSDKSSRSIIKKRKKRMIWGDIVNNDEYFMELNEDGTTIKCSTCDDTKAKIELLLERDTLLQLVHGISTRNIYSTKLLLQK